jgi:hypothetical protein
VSDEPFPYDRASKWLIERHGNSVLRLAGISDVAEWRPLPAEIVQPRALPDGLLEVRRTGEDRPSLYVIEVATDPERRTAGQLLGDAAAVYLARGRLPEVIAVVLRPKGRRRVPQHLELQSPGGLTTLRLSWRVVELWSESATAMIATGEPGLAPWATIASWDGPPEVLMRRSREAMDQWIGSPEHQNLLAAAVTLASLKYRDPKLLNILGGRKAVIESPLWKELFAEQFAEQFAEKMHRTICNVLRTRLGDIPADVEAEINSVRDEGQLDRANVLAAQARSFAAFRRALAKLTAAQEQPTRRR